MQIKISKLNTTTYFMLHSQGLENTFREHSAHITILNGLYLQIAIQTWVWSIYYFKVHTENRNLGYTQSILFQREFDMQDKNSMKRFLDGGYSRFYYYVQKIWYVFHLKCVHVVEAMFMYGSSLNDISSIYRIFQVYTESG